MPDYALLRLPPFSLSDAEVSWVKNTLQAMDDTDKIGQLFHLITYTADEDYLRHLCEVYRPGGIMSRTLPLEEVCFASNTLQRYSTIPLFISANLEAGGDGIVREGTNVGPNMMIAATGNVSNAALQGKIAGVEGAAVGANVAFAPVVDIDYNFRNPITNTRTYGADPRFVAKAGAAFVQAVQKEGLSATVKHFPGDGVDERDQHLVTSVNTLSCEEWDATYGRVYRECIQAGTMTIMVGHIMLPAYSKYLRPTLHDEEIMPATLAPELLGDLLRKKLAFNGLIITDASTMAGMTIPMDRRRALPYSIEAGCDMFLFTKNLDEDYGFMRDGLQNGMLSRARLDEAVMRILGLKAALHLPQKKADNSIYVNIEEAGKTVGQQCHLDAENQIAEQAITLVKDTENLLPIDAHLHRRVLLYPLTNGENDFGSGGGEDIGGMFASALEAEGFSVTLFEGGGGFEGMAAPYSSITEHYDLLIYVANLATRSNQTSVRIEWASPMGANCPAYLSVVPTIFISFANPYHLLDVPRIRTYINAYKCKPATVRAVVDKLIGNSPFRGTSPIDPFCGKWDTRL